jgi:hypothetical protein
VANVPLTDNFKSFFGKLNPDPTAIGLAAREHARVTTLIESQTGPAAVISPTCFLQGSYKQQTAIHGINDVDVVALCALWQPPQPGTGPGSIWNRDHIFDVIASSITKDVRFADKVSYKPDSMCIKVYGDVKIEVLPVVYTTNNNDSSKEPFRLYRPSTGEWSDGFARHHQWFLSWKNGQDKTGCNFIPAIKVFKHIRTRFQLQAVSFHIECLLYSLPDALFMGAPADYLSNLFSYISSSSASGWYATAVNTPCGDRDIFTNGEWSADAWGKFHELSGQITNALRSACATTDPEEAIRLWQLVLGDDVFPHL